MIETSTISLVPQTKLKRDSISAIFDIVKEMSVTNTGALVKEVSIGEIRERVINKGYTEQELDKCIKTYADDDIWMVCGNDQSRLRWLMIEDE
jgi:DNA replicative helicase MCM subunit Mcm2 (Cdc46/Mcm family)